MLHLIGFFDLRVLRSWPFLFLQCVNYYFYLRCYFIMVLCANIGRWRLKTCFIVLSVFFLFIRVCVCVRVRACVWEFDRVTVNLWTCKVCQHVRTHVRMCVCLHECFETLSEPVRDEIKSLDIQQCSVNKAMKPLSSYHVQSSNLKQRKPL